ncbi:hypothetical protein Kpol_1014p20 [Vanderwaltozyma polyspora DSM 70294]|uniref:Major facilitator superfamily (MFS) profile domain-containing protein n=1 Tax=Vanderwaltozyma polyspora (strain ATCC 22028 / DSM 70294 / BCRC 21397 / CBS 2163 / NBRC 10782 / NRRL Y-8283 / UCD 57-17) TaxID=436907 RepID=A7TNE8_VANPO|nr:uncharacterized protein Kpol_1014p20 [Vanderwaltozyma polyspora DSM 70294]EDO16201.1 hypothetical protein Kpol_1014p20 [Vanderwaltozyma polyspora DSM 70294]
MESSVEESGIDLGQDTITSSLQYKEPPHGGQEEVHLLETFEDSSSPSVPLTDSANVEESIGVREVIWHGEMVTLYPSDIKSSRMVLIQVIFCMCMFLVFGMNDQSTGSLAPTLIADYDTSIAQLSNIFLVAMAGYTLASFLNDKIHRAIGSRGAMFLSTSMCIVFYGIMASKPSNIYVYIFCMLPLGLSLGLLDSTSNVLIGSLRNHSSELMGILHGVYGAAAMVTPPLVDKFVQSGKWEHFFLIPTSLSIVGLLLIIPSFKYETAAKYDYICATAHHDEDDIVSDGDIVIPKSKELHFFDLMKNPAILLYSIYLFLYLGAEVGTGSWMFTYLLATKSDNKTKMSYVTSSYWSGLTFGRFVLGFVTKRAFKNVYRATYTYGLLTVVFYTLFAALGLINSDSTLYLFFLSLNIFLAGVFIGPLFPNASIVFLQVLPKNLHIAGMGASVAVGGCGGALLPYLIGNITHWIGIFLFPLLCWILVVTFSIIWDLYPRFIKDKEEFL